jgi:hypothetical protein
MQFACSVCPRPAPAGLVPRSFASVAGSRLRHLGADSGLHPASSALAPFGFPAWISGAWPQPSTWLVFAPSRWALHGFLLACRPRTPATTAFADFSLQLLLSPFQAQSEISPGKNALLHCTTAGYTPPALITRASRLLARSPCRVAPPIRFLFIGSQFTLHASSPHSVTLVQLRFASLAVISSRRDLHPQECAHAGRTSG